MIDNQLEGTSVTVVLIGYEKSYKEVVVMKLEKVINIGTVYSEFISIIYR
jgi:hypothetical protein